MATIVVYYFKGAVTSATANRDAITTGWTGSALAFTGAAGPNTNITVGTFNTQTWIIEDSATPGEGTAQTDNWAWQDSEGNDTAAALNVASGGAIVDLQLDTSAQIGFIGRSTLGFTFEHGSNVNCNPVNLWAGVGTDVDNALEACDMKGFDLTLAQANAAKAWINLDFNGDGAKITSSAHTGTAVQSHWWGYGITLVPTDVGTRTANALKWEVTYF